MGPPKQSLKGLGYRSLRPEERKKGRKEGRKCQAEPNFRNDSSDIVYTTCAKYAKYMLQLPEYELYFAIVVDAIQSHCTCQTLIRASEW